MGKIDVKARDLEVEEMFVGSIFKIKKIKTNRLPNGTVVLKFLCLAFGLKSIC